MFTLFVAFIFAYDLKIPLLNYAYCNIVLPLDQSLTRFTFQCFNLMSHMDIERIHE